MGVVGRGKVAPADGHLEDLGRGDERGEGDGEPVEAGGHGEVVGVHDAVHGEVHGGEPEPRRDSVVVSVPAIEHHGAVVEPVEEYHFLLLKHQEDSVEELRDLRKYEEADPKPHRAVQIPFFRVGADGVVKSTSVDDLVQARHGSSCPNYTENRK